MEIDCLGTLWSELVFISVLATEPSKMHLLMVYWLLGCYGKWQDFVMVEKNPPKEVEEFSQGTLASDFNLKT